MRLSLMSKDTPSPSSDFLFRHRHWFLERWVLRCRFQGHSTEDVRVVAGSFRFDDAVQVVLSMPRVILLSLCNTFLSTSFSCQAPAPSTTMTSAHGLGAETVGTSALRAVPWLHEHPERCVVKPVGHCVYVSVDGVLAESSDVHGSCPPALIPCS